MSWIPLIVGVLAIFTHLLFKRVVTPVGGSADASVPARIEPATLSLNFLLVAGGIPALTVLGGAVWMIVLLHRRGQFISPLLWAIIAGSLLGIGGLAVAYVKRNCSDSLRPKANDGGPHYTVQGPADQRSVSRDGVGSSERSTWLSDIPYASVLATLAAIIFSAVAVPRAIYYRDTDAWWVILLAPVVISGMAFIYGGLSMRAKGLTFLATFRELESRKAHEHSEQNNER
jgi:hypothetical protein